jgi:hypothetical protein
MTTDDLRRRRLAVLETHLQDLRSSLALATERNLPVNTEAQRGGYRIVNL